MEHCSGRSFFGNASNGVVDAASYHHYYGSGKTATVSSAHSPATLDRFVSAQQAIARDLASTASAATPIWIDESSSFYGGGAANVSDRFVAGFTWLDKLGAAARLGVAVVCRQAWRGGAYGLLDQACKDKFCPTPDYFSAVLHKRLMGSRVLDVDGSLASGRSVRVWAHCTGSRARDANGHVYAAGSVTLMVLNTLNETTNITFTNEGLLSGGWDEYVLTPGDMSLGLSSKTISLNGEVLRQTAEGALPPMGPRSMTGQTINLAPSSYGFFVLHSAKAYACADSLETTSIA